MFSSADGVYDMKKHMIRSPFRDTNELGMGAKFPLHRLGAPAVDMFVIQDIMLWHVYEPR